MNLLKQLFSAAATDLTAAAAQARLQGANPPYLLDVRQPEEYQAGHIAGAALIPLDQLDSRLDELPQGREIVCVCRSGSRSGTAVRRLKSAGFTALNLSGGMIAWQRAGLPVKKGKAR